MFNRAIIIVCAVVVSLSGCSSVQMRYTATDPASTIVTDYRMTKKTKKAWDNTLYRSFPIYRKVAAADIEKYGVAKTVFGYCIFVIPPVVDLAILPFQALYDLAFTYKREYQERALIDGCFADEQGNPLAGLTVSISGSEVVTDAAGRVHTTIRYAGRYEPSGQIVVKTDAAEWEAVRAGYAGGDRKTLALPPQIRYSFRPSPDNGEMVRDDFVIAEKINPAGRDEITARWEASVSSGSVIQLRRRVFFSENNRLITLREYIAGQLRKIQSAWFQLGLFDPEDIFAATRDTAPAAQSVVARQKSPNAINRYPVFHVSVSTAVAVSTTTAPGQFREPRR